MADSDIGPVSHGHFGAWPAQQWGVGEEADAEPESDGRMVLSAASSVINMTELVLNPFSASCCNCCCSKGSAPYWSNPPFLIFDIRALWRSGLSARAPECQKIKNGGLETSIAKCKALTGSAVKGLMIDAALPRVHNHVESNSF